MAELNTALQVDLHGNIERRAERWQRQMRQFSQRGQRYMGRLGRGVTAASDRISRLGNVWTAIGSGAVAGLAIRSTIQMEQRLTRLGIAAGASEKRMDSLKQRIYETAQMDDIRVDPKQLLGAIDEILERTGDLEFAESNLRNIGLALQASGAQGMDIGGIMAEFQKMGVEGPDKVLSVLDTLVRQGKEGAFTLQHLARLGPRVISAYTSARPGKGAEALKEMGAALQVIRKGTGNAEQAATAFEAIMRTLSDPKKLEMLRSGGIQVFDPEALKEGKEVMRPINEIMAEIVKATDGRRTLIGQVFDAEAIRGFNSILGEFGRQEEIDSLERFMELHGEGAQLMADSERAAGTASAALQDLHTSWNRFADRNLAGPIEDLADALDTIDPEHVQALLETAKWAAIGGGSIWAAGKAIKGVSAVRRMMGRGGAGGVAGAVGATTGVQPVYVVNMPGGRRGWRNMRRRVQRSAQRSGGGAMRRGARAGGAATGGGFFARNWRRIRGVASRLAPAAKTAGKTAAKGLGVAGSAYTGYEMGQLLSKHVLDRSQIGRDIGESIASHLSFLPGVHDPQDGRTEAAMIQLEILNDKARVKRAEGSEVEVTTRTGMWGAN